MEMEDRKVEKRDCDEGGRRRKVSGDDGGYRGRRWRGEGMRTAVLQALSCGVASEVHPAFDNTSAARQMRGGAISALAGALTAPPPPRPGSARDVRRGRKGRTNGYRRRRLKPLKFFFFVLNIGPPRPAPLKIPLPLAPDPIAVFT